VLWWEILFRSMGFCDGFQAGSWERIPVEESWEESGWILGAPPGDRFFARGSEWQYAVRRPEAWCVRSLAAGWRVMCDAPDLRILFVILSQTKNPAEPWVRRSGHRFFAVGAFRMTTWCEPHFGGLCSFLFA